MIATKESASKRVNGGASMRNYSFTLLGIVMALCSCSSQEHIKAPGTVNTLPANEDNDKRLAELKKTIATLDLTQAQLAALLSSDFATCPSSGETADPLINKICKVAKAATVEDRVKLQSQLSSYIDKMGETIDSMKEQMARGPSATDMVTVNALITSIQGQITSVTTSISTLQTQMSSVQSAVSALQTLTGAINGTLSGAMESVEIGTENSSIGPVAESVLRRIDRTRINAYVEAWGPQINLANDPVTVTNGSSTGTVAITAHGLVVGDMLHVSGLTEGKGLSAGDVNGEFLVQSVINANSLTIIMGRAATSSGNTGGTLGFGKQIIGRAMSTVWTAADGADSAVRTTSGATRKYNFIIKQVSGVWNLCYDKTNRSATFATINAVGTNIICK